MQTQIYTKNNRFYVKTEFDEKKDARKAKRIQNVERVCGSVISKWNKSHHRKTNKHLIYENAQTLQKNK